MYSFTTEITVCICEGTCPSDHSLVMRPEHYKVLYELSGPDLDQYLNVLIAALATDIDRAILIPDTLILANGRDPIFQKERNLVGDAGLRNLCLELLNHALGLAVDFSVIIESCTLTEARSGLEYTQIAS